MCASVISRASPDTFEGFYHLAIMSGSKVKAVISVVLQNVISFQYSVWDLEHD